MAFGNDAARRLCRMLDVCGVVRVSCIFEYADELIGRVPVAPCAVREVGCKDYVGAVPRIM